MVIDCFCRSRASCQVHIGLQRGKNVCKTCRNLRNLGRLYVLHLPIGCSVGVGRRYPPILQKFSEGIDISTPTHKPMGGVPPSPSGFALISTAALCASRMCGCGFRPMGRANDANTRHLRAFLVAF